MPDENSFHGNLYVGNFVKSFFEVTVQTIYESVYSGSSAHKNKQTEGQTDKCKLHLQTTANYNTQVQTI